MVGDSLTVPRAAGQAGRAPLRAGGAALLAALTLCLGATAGQAQNANWVGGNPGDTAEWLENNNWAPATIPTGTATFTNVASSTAVANDAGIVIIGAINFTPTALAYTFSINNPFIINGAGVANNSTNTQTFNVTGGNSLVFQNGSTANSGTGNVTYTSDSFISFQDNSNAGNSHTTIVNNGVVQFSNSSSAGAAQITNNVEMDFFGIM